MELPRRTRGDELLKPGELTGVRERLRIRDDAEIVFENLVLPRSRFTAELLEELRTVAASGRRSFPVGGETGDKSSEQESPGWNKVKLWPTAWEPISERASDIAAHPSR